MVKGKNLQPRILYPVRLSFTFYGEIKSFKDKQNLRRIQHNQSNFATNTEGTPPGRKETSNLKLVHIYTSISKPHGNSKQKNLNR